MRTLAGAPIRGFGPTKILYHLEHTTESRDEADCRATRIRRRGYGARITHESGQYKVWESHFARLPRGSCQF